MELDITKIITDKIAQMETEGIVQKTIESEVERVVLKAVANGIDSYEVRNIIEKQLKEAVSGIAEDCGLSAYNSFIVKHVREVVSTFYSQDITEKLRTALDTILIRKEGKVKLSSIFEEYRDFILGYTSESEKRDYECFEASLDVDDNPPFHHYVCRFADHPLSDDDIWCKKEDAAVEIRFCTYRDESEKAISSLKLNGEYLDKIAKVADLNEFEAYVVNLYLNGTPVELDVGEAENIDTGYDSDW